MGTTVQDVGKGGHRCPYLGKNLRVGGTGVPDVWVGDVGDDTTHWEGSGRILPQGGPKANISKSLSDESRYVRLFFTPFSITIVPAPEGPGRHCSA